MRKLDKFSEIASFFILLCFFIVQYLVFGLVTATDTVRFEAFSPLTYPLYPVALWFFRTLFGKSVGYFLLGLFQNLLLATSIFSLNNYVRKAFKLDWFTYYFLLIVFSLVFLVQKYFTRAGIISSNTLFSEALAIPLYLFFFRYALQTVLEHKKWPFIYACIFATSIILTRGQLYWLIVVIFALRMFLSNGNYKKALLSAIFICATVVGCVQGARFIQTVSIPEYEKNPANLYLCTTAVYCSKNEDVALWEENSAEQQLFRNVRTWIDNPEHHASISYETGDFTSRQKLFEATYDDLKHVITTHHEILSEKGYSISLSKFTAMLIWANPWSFLLHCIQNMLTALIRTVAILRPGINVLAFLFYAYLIVCLWIGSKNQNLKKVCQLTYLCLLCVLLNALTMAPGVFALSRYMFYNMPILYLTAVLLLRSLILEWRKTN